MELSLSFRIGMIKIFNDFVKNNSKNIEYNYTMLVSINILKSIDKNKFNGIDILLLNHIPNAL